MRGDTVVAQFTPSDSAGKKRAVLSRIEARAAAQSYHLDRNAKAPQRPSINYARGDAIIVTMKNTADGRGGPGGHPGQGGRHPARGRGADIDRDARPTRTAAPGRRPMSAPEWIAALGDRDPSVADRAGRHHPGGRPERRGRRSPTWS